MRSTAPVAVRLGGIRVVVDPVGSSGVRLGKPGGEVGEGLPQTVDLDPHGLCLGIGYGAGPGARDAEPGGVVLANGCGYAETGHTHGRRASTPGSGGGGSGAHWTAASSRTLISSESVGATASPAVV